LLAIEARLVDVPFAPSGTGARHGENAPFPGLVKDGLVLLALDGAEIIHPAHVMDAVHRVPPAGSVTFAVPIMASRLTSSASCSSLIPSLPSGRSGSTR